MCAGFVAAKPPTNVLPSSTAEPCAGMDAALRKNLEDQRDRLLTQLNDIEELKADLTPEEYQEQKDDTVAQLKEFEAMLVKQIAGDSTLTLQSQLDATRMAVRAAISQAFKTPEVRQPPARRR